MVNKDFCVFILTHGRPDNIITIDTLKRHGYTGPIFFIIDNEDSTANRYYEKYGNQVVMFDKSAIAKEFDEGDNFDDRRTITYARNACFKIAKDLGYTYFIQLEDDYYWFGYRTEKGGASIKNLNNVFQIMLNFFEKSRALSIAFSQGGDHIGGYNPQKTLLRKCMNSFICSIDRPFKWIGRFNEDVNTYTLIGSQGGLFFTIYNLQLDQKDSQSNPGGITELYKKFGTYVKSFMTVMYSPSCVKVKMMISRHPRLHHSVCWRNAVPVIIREEFKKN